jgi:hypothetical protein
MVAMELDLFGGFHIGPLFQIHKRRMPKRYGTVLQNRIRRREEARATPPWADRAAIRAVFAERDRITKETGVQYSVDHIVPLLNPIVCGLHVHWNLRVITLDENQRKANNFWPDMPNQQMELGL